METNMEPLRPDGFSDAGFEDPQARGWTLKKVTFDSLKVRFDSLPDADFLLHKI